MSLILSQRLSDTCTGFSSSHVHVKIETSNGPQVRSQ